MLIGQAAHVSTCLCWHDCGCGQLKMAKFRPGHEWHGVEFYPPRQDITGLQCQWHAATLFLRLREADAESADERKRVRRKIQKLLPSVKELHHSIWPGAQEPILPPASSPKLKADAPGHTT